MRDFYFTSFSKVSEDLPRARLGYMLGWEAGTAATLDVASRALSSSDASLLEKALWNGLSEDLGSERPVVLLGISELLSICKKRAQAAGDTSSGVSLALFTINRLFEAARIAIPHTARTRAGEVVRPFTVQCANVVLAAVVCHEEVLRACNFSIRRSNAYLMPSGAMGEEWVERADRSNVERLVDQVLGEEEKVHFAPTPLIIISDPGKDNDDELALIMTRAMCDMGLFDLKGVVANLCPSVARARLARGTLDCLEMDYVPVAVGSDGGSRTHTDTFSGTVGSTGVDYLSDEVEHDAQQMLVQLVLND